MTHPVSIVVLVKNRQHHLHNLLKGVNQLTSAPVEVIVVHMNEPVAPPPDFFRGPYVGTQVHHSETPLPLAQARNRGATLAKGQELIFLDVDCVPAPDLVKDYRLALAQHPGAIAMGGVFYLSTPLPDYWQLADLQAQGHPHPARQYPHHGEFVPTTDYHLFWSLNFAIARATWRTIGGFDERFQGYGAEDTDFAFTAQAAQVPLIWVGGAHAYHQHHAQYSPPLQHFHDIVKNATAFYQKWGWWPMEKWLQQFAESGYIRWTLASSSIVVIQPPGIEAVAAARQQ